MKWIFKIEEGLTGSNTFATNLNETSVASSGSLKQSQMYLFKKDCLLPFLYEAQNGSKQ